MKNFEIIKRYFSEPSVLELKSHFGKRRNR